MRKPAEAAAEYDRVPPPRWLPAKAVRLLAWRRALAGRYDAETEALFYQVWRKGGGLRGLVDWLRFRRELGHPLDERHAQILADTLIGTRNDLTARGLELLVEADVKESLASISWSDWLQPYAESSPPIATVLRDAGGSLGTRAAQLAGLHRSQDRWRTAFSVFLGDCRGDICVVGNGGSLKGAGLGSWIDDHRCVVRFNHWKSDESVFDDLGTRIDVWVCAPGFLPRAVEIGLEPPSWLVLVGPDVRFRRAGAGVNWEPVLSMLEDGVKVLTIPLPMWKEAVALLNAPPSAGISFILWLRHLAGGLQGLSVVGFDAAGIDGGNYHHAFPRKRPGWRHDWDREAAVLSSLEDEGLRVMRKR
jgi:hypothetical protein